MTLVKTSILSFFATATKMLSALVINKAIAIYIGPTGLALVGQFQNFIQLIMVAAQGAITGGITKYTAEYGSKSERLPVLLGTATRIGITTSTLVGVLIFIFSEYLSVLVLESSDYDYIFFILSVSLIFFVINNFLLAILNGLKEIRVWISVNVCQSIISLIFTSVLIYFLGLHGALIALVTNQSLVLLVVVFLLKKHKIINFKLIKSKFDCLEAKKLSSYALMTITSAITVPATQLIIRNHIGDTISWEAAGHWQAMWYISSMYLSVITTTLSIYYLPKLSEIKARSEFRKEIISGYKLVMPLVIFLAIVIYLLKDFIVWLLFSEQFTAMRDLFLLQLIGDVLKMASWLIAYIMIAKALKKQFIITEILFSVTFVVFSVFLIFFNGLVGVTYAYALNYLLYFFVVFLITKSYWLES